MDKKQHWENVFANKKQNEVSWYEALPKTSIDLFESQNISKDSHVIDVGSGDSYFIDYLVNNGYKNVYALDISKNALDRLKERLGNKADQVNFIVSDILDLKITIQFDYWHDRAVFHFLTNMNDVAKYIAIANDSIAANGKLVIGTFAETGPMKCSGLGIKQYSKESLEKVFSGNFQKINCVNETHVTPFNTNQNFTFCSFKRPNHEKISI